MTDDREARAKHAQQLLDDPLFNEAFNAIESECITQWRDTPVRDTEARERIWMMVRLNQRLKDHYRAVIDDGKMASAEAAEIERQRSLAERVVSMFGT